MSIELVVTQEQYDAGLEHGWTGDDMLKPGRYKLKRGGFRATSGVEDQGKEARVRPSQ